MDSIISYMTHDHGECDELFTKAEKFASSNSWVEAKEFTKKFVEKTLVHFSMEEEILFPAFDQRMGHSMGPTAVMRAEHEQLRNLCRILTDAAESQDKKAFLGTSETILMMLQQHNIKEESILYPMSERMLGDVQGEIMAEMKKIHNKTLD